MRRLTSIQTSDPLAELITLAQAQARLRRGDGEDDGTIELVIVAALSQLDGVDGILGRALVSQGWADQLSGFPIGDRLPIVLAPVISVDSVTYFDADNVEQVLSPSAYALGHDCSGAYLRLDPNWSWPSTYDRDDAVTLSYAAGYGPAATDVPAAIRLAALDLVEHWYEPGVRVNTDEVPVMFMAKLRRFIRPKF
ncbi:head-tail connector protein [Pseudooceanicola algae]|uniref:Phage gp6-like head-tail connector protein n=1 Tax=Pseudooceanicola algae TaxID=1537215 RepID=A0A418SDD9_9RHOB|nr:hypothetical protein [Pseudooceanicola algae]QPM89378.1 hypothetical protein PSAL_005940 [Pseudooceanicola algae]